jgi:hypothetical protein
MERHAQVFTVSAVLVMCLLIAAGCTSIPGPESRQIPVTASTTVPVTPQVKAPAQVTTLPPPVPVTTSIPSPAQVTPASTAPGTYELRTCTQAAGTVVLPGEKCPGSWLTASDTFSCCSQKAVRAIDRNASITVVPFDLTIAMDDTIGSTLP